MDALTSFFSGDKQTAHTSHVQPKRGEMSGKEICAIYSGCAIALALFILGVLCITGVLPFGIGGALCFFTASILVFTAIVVKAAELRLQKNRVF